MNTRENLIERVLRDVSFRLPCGGAFIDFKDERYITLVRESLERYGVSQTEADDVVQGIQTKDNEKPETNNPPPEDVALLHRLGLDMRDDEIGKIDLNSVDENKTIFDTGSGHRVFQSKKLSYKQLEDFINTQKVCYATTARTISKIRSENNIRVIEWGRSKGPGRGPYDQIVSIFKLIKSSGGKIQISNKAPVGMNYELTRAEEINKVLESSAIPFRLFIEKDGIIKDMGISVKKAHKIVGTGKADIALLDEHNSEVFWLSYKHGDFFGKEGQVAKHVPFQQYGSLQGLYDKSLESDEDLDVEQGDATSKDIKKVVNHFVHSTIVKSGMEKYSILDVEEVTGTPDGNYEIHKADGTSQVIKEDDIRFKALDDIEFYRRIVKFLKAGPGNIHFFLQGVKEHYFNFLKSKMLDQKILNNIAGKSIYGADFYVGNYDFSRENVNLLLQTSRTLEVGQHKQAKNTDAEEIDGIVIKTDEMGHILFNPNLPDEDVTNMFKTIDQYTPVLYVRFTTKETFRWSNETGRNIILGGRCMIIPQGKKASTAIEIV